MKTLVFATNNPHKLKEIKAKVGDSFEIKSLKDIEVSEDIPEPYETLEENAFNKARYIHEKFGYDCFADDTGLEIDALNGRPGVYSARYAGPQCHFQDNINKVLREMEDKSNRSARFRCVIALILNGKEHKFEGAVEGKILTEEHGSEGFGYDPLFQPLGYNQSFAEMPLEIKNQISHRGKAVAKLTEFLRKQTM
ncbi:MAG: non-canonical purine NTP diphosphatase [Bacteroidales bacterium]|nr:non-canonical purine NTP diphosphatase [Bacteroidales bacterium]